MAEQIHHVERIEFTISFNVARANEVGLVDVIDVKRTGKIRVLNALGNIRSFF